MLTFPDFTDRGRPHIHVHELLQAQERNHKHIKEYKVPFFFFGWFLHRTNTVKFIWQLSSFTCGGTPPCIISGTSEHTSRATKDPYRFEATTMKGQVSNISEIILYYYIYNNNHSTYISSADLYYLLLNQGLCPFLTIFLVVLPIKYF